MKQIIQEDIVVSIKGQKTHTGCQYIDIGYISKVKNIGSNRLYFNETPDGTGAYDIKNFRHATPEEIKAYEAKGPHVLQKEKT